MFVGVRCSFVRSLRCVALRCRLLWLLCLLLVFEKVFWTALPEVELPADLVARFKGKGMAVVGFEADQVRRVNGTDISVPINIAYNRTFVAFSCGWSRAGEGGRGRLHLALKCFTHYDVLLSGRARGH